MEKTNKPVWELRLGAIRGAIFRNLHGDQEYLNFSITRRFKQGTEWMSSNSFTGLADLAQVRQVVELAITWLAQHEATPTSGTGEE